MTHPVSTGNLSRVRSAAFEITRCVKFEQFKALTESSALEISVSLCQITNLHQAEHIFPLSTLAIPKLSAMIQELKDRATFTVGGRVQIRTQPAASPEQSQPAKKPQLRASPPVTIRWDSDDGSGRKLVLPLADRGTALRALVRD